MKRPSMTGCRKVIPSTAFSSCDGGWGEAGSLALDTVSLRPTRGVTRVEQRALGGDRPEVGDLLVAEHVQPEGLGGVAEVHQHLLDLLVAHLLDVEVGQLGEAGHGGVGHVFLLPVRAIPRRNSYIFIISYIA